MIGRTLTRGAAMSLCVLAALLPAPAVADFRLDVGMTTPVPAPDELPVTVTLTGVSPLDPAGSGADAVTFDAVVRNRSDQTLLALNAYLRVSRLPFAQRADLDQLADPAYRPGSRRDVFTRIGDTLAPGASETFRLEVPVEALGLSQPGVYPAGIEILATVEDGSRDEVGRAMTALPWLPADDVGGIGPIEVSLIWPVTAAVDRTLDGSYLSEELGEALAADGRLGAIAAVPSSAPVTWLLDPAVVEAAVDLADGYRVRAPDNPGTTAVGAHAADAARWLTAVRRLARSADVRLAPYGAPDVVALSRAGLTDVVAGSVARAAAAAGSARLTGLDTDLTLTRPPGGALDQTTLDVLAAAGIDTVVLDDTAVTGADGSSLRLATDGDPVTALVADGALAEVLAGPDDDRSVQARQLLLAHTALLALAADAAGDPPPDLVVAAAEESSTHPLLVVDALGVDVPWLTASPLAVTDGAAEGQLSYGDAARAAELPPAYLAGLAAAAGKLALRSAVLGEPADGAPSDVLRAASATWRTDHARAAALVADLSGAVDGELARVQILDTGGITLSSRTGRFPVTIENGLDQTVTVNLTLAPRTPARLRVPPVATIELSPGSRQTVDVSAEATANGTYAIAAQLAAQNGAPFGPVQTLTIRATDYDTVAWVVMGVAGGLLLIGSGRRILRRVRGQDRPSRSDRQVPAEGVHP